MAKFETKQIQTKNQFFVWVQQQIQAVSTFGRDRFCCRSMRLTKSSEGLIFKNKKNDNTTHYYNIDRPLTRKSNTRIKNNVARIDFLPSPVGRGGNRKAAFTLTEVLITLGIIGVVAAMTLPTIITKYQKQEVVSKLKKVNTILNQMVLWSYDENGSMLNSAVMSTINAETSKEFFEVYILPYFSAPNVFAENIYPYGKMYPYYALRGNVADESNISTKYSSGRIVFSSQDGIIYTIFLSSNPRILIDINGLKGPNIFGKDVFEATIDFQNNRFEPHAMINSIASINNTCRKTGTGRTCFAKIVKDGWEIKDDYPW